MTEQTPIARAADLASRLGVRTQAKTLKGLLAAIRRAPYGRPNGQTYQAPKRFLVPMSRLMAGFNQGHARARTIDPHQPLLVAVSAAIGHDSIGSIGAVANSYRGPAMESVTSATRNGGAIMIFWGRVEMPHRPHGRGVKPIMPDGSQVIRRSSIMEAIRLPAGWRWAADQDGPFVTGPGASTYHPTGASLAQAIQTRDWTQIQAKAQAAR